MEKIKQWIVAHKVWSIVIASVLVVAIALSIALPLALRHKHSYSDDWSTDASYHWHICTGEKCDEITDKAEHTFVDNSNDTQYWLECSVCGYTKDVVTATVDDTTLANALDFKDADGNDYTNWEAEKIGSDGAGGSEVKFRVNYTGDAYQAYNKYATTNQEVLYINSYDGENEVKTVYKKNAGEDWTKTELSGHSNVQGLAKQCLKLTEFMGGLTFEYNSADKAYCATKLDGTPTETRKQEYTYKLFFENGKLVSVQSIRTKTTFATDTEAEKVRILDEYTWIISYDNATIEIPTVKKALISLVCTIALLGVAIIGGYIFVRSKYGIDLFRTAGQLKVLSEKVDESKLCPTAFGEEDFAGLKSALDSDLASGFISFSEGSGYNGYSIVYSAITGDVSASELKISEKQTGALGQIIFYEQTEGGKISVSGKDLTTTIKQIDFSNIENGNANLNIVVQIDLTPFTSEMSGFPYSLFKKYIPDSLYVSSTVFVEKEGTEMGYKVSHKELKINNLSSEDTDDLFHTLDTVLKIGSAENLNVTIGSTVAQVLIGNSENKGFAYSLKGIFNTYNFKTIADVDYFVIEK